MLKRLSAILLVMLSFTLFFNCGKKDDTKTGDGKTDSKTTSKDENLSPDKPFHVVFDMKSAGEKGMNGTVDAVYYGKKCRSQSSMTIGNQKMSATAYYTGGDTVYMVTEIGGM